MREDVTPVQNSWKSRLKKLGLAGFLFFLIKGLLWLIIPYLIASGLWTCQ
jgi:hypothetical protein